MVDRNTGTSPKGRADSRRLEDLVPEAAEKARKIRAGCEAAGFGLLIYCTLRPLERQAILYREGHTRDRVDLKTAQLRSDGFGFLADILVGVGPQPTGRNVTEAGPGESWHNFAEAFDAVPQVGGREAWNYEDAPDEWETYGRLVREAGMTWGGDWSKFRDYPHAQLKPDANPLRTIESAQIAAMLRERGLLA